jgi:hypothetical protein
MSKNVHIVPHDSGWAVRIEGNDRASSVHSTQRGATQAGRDRARRDGVEILIHGEDGRIRARDSYGNDPFPPKG